MLITQACNDILKFTENITYEEVAKNKLIRYAVERQLLVIGEAANHLSGEFTKHCSHIPWKHIIGLRNIIAHDYGEILVDRIWITVKSNIKELYDNLIIYVD